MNETPSGLLLFLGRHRPAPHAVVLGDLTAVPDGLIREFEAAAILGASHDTFHEVTARRIYCIGSRCLGLVLSEMRRES